MRYPDFFNEAVSNYVVFAAGLIVGAVVWAFSNWWNKKRASVVEVHRMNPRSLMEIAEEAKNLLQITFNNKVISQLYEDNLLIQNMGESTINDIKLVIVLPSKSAVIVPVLWPRLRAGRAVKLSHEAADEIGFTLIITIEYLNSYRDHKDQIGIQIYSEQSFRKPLVYGGGPGWSVKCVDVHGGPRKPRLSITYNPKDS